ncbi:Uncharacterized protein M6B38_232085 [Iris pallida]|uniref:Uncharacterized protein n=1 Tax=Iris pallida TaxID=29817 RepID=A0AAX6DRH7_IRIPA|nr:Uncharacterized protein M6B38_232085 [Iris pallida]
MPKNFGEIIQNCTRMKADKVTKLERKQQKATTQILQGGGRLRQMKLMLERFSKRERNRVMRR